MIHYQASDGSIRSMLSQNELYHYGVKGMKWGHRKRVESVSSTGSRRRFGQTTNTGSSNRQTRNQANGGVHNSPEARAQRAARAKKAAKIGMAVAGTALAAYGTYKLAKYVQDNRTKAAIAMAQDYLHNNQFNLDGDFTRIGRGPEVRVNMSNRAGDEIGFIAKNRDAAMAKAIEYRDRAKAEADRIYKDATNTRWDKGLAKVVNAGDTVGRTTKRAVNSVGNTAKRAANKTKNRVLDVVAPIYEYDPGSTRKKKRR